MKVDVLDVRARRRKRLQELIDAEYAGVIAAFARAHGLNASQVWHFLSSSYRNGGSFGERSARNLEGRLGLPAMYFDRDIPSEEVRQLPVAKLLTLAVTRDEFALLALYRQLAVQDQATVQEKIFEWIGKK